MRHVEDVSIECLEGVLTFNVHGRDTETGMALKSYHYKRTAAFQGVGVWERWVQRTLNGMLVYLKGWVL